MCSTRWSSACPTTCSGSGWRRWCNPGRARNPIRPRSRSTSAATSPGTGPAQHLAHRHDQAHGVRQGRLRLGARVRRRPRPATRAHAGEPPGQDRPVRPARHRAPHRRVHPVRARRRRGRRAGGLGVLGCVRFNDPAELDTVLDWMDLNTDGRPYGINVVMPARVPAEGGQHGPQPADPAGPQGLVEQTLLRLGVPPLPDDARPPTACSAGCTRSRASTSRSRWATRRG